MEAQRAQGAAAGVGAAGAGAAAAAPPAAAQCKHSPICTAVAAGYKCACGWTSDKALGAHHVCMHNSSDAHLRKIRAPPPGGACGPFFQPLLAGGSASARAGGGSASAAEEGEEAEAEAEAAQLDSLFYEAGEEEDAGACSAAAAAAEEEEGIGARTLAA